MDNFDLITKLTPFLNRTASSTSRFLAPVWDFDDVRQDFIIQLLELQTRHIDKTFEDLLKMGFIVVRRRRVRLLNTHFEKFRVDIDALSSSETSRLFATAQLSSTNSALFNLVHEFFLTLSVPEERAFFQMMVSPPDPSLTARDICFELDRSPSWGSKLKSRLQADLHLFMEQPRLGAFA